MPDDDQHLDGLDNPGRIDAVVIPPTGAIELVLRHPEPWDASEHRQLLLQEKLNRYLEHVLDGELAAEHPEARGRSWVVVIACGDEPDPRSAEYLRHAHRELASSGGGVVVRVTA